MMIDYAVEEDYDYIVKRDKHVLKGLVEQKIKGKEIFIVRNEQNQYIGWMRYNYFWDNTPFMNMIWIEEPYRSQGIGKEVVHYWEALMREKGFGLVMTSTLANEAAQHFYRKLGYKDAGCLLLENESLEIILTKTI